MADTGRYRICGSVASHHLIAGPGTPVTTSFQLCPKSKLPLEPLSSNPRDHPSGIFTAALGSNRGSG
ncbi:uncharacterized protein PGTG_22425 [Puccinia graminis f. sp. tritici CRL 75-36-700-3]|uniref:Uncharacterized protein n=1 Tax=Puccinia graminis f. sp. tritici (strain CRL 75-36-700-3 / race SCCL) TaxID=418459 RepID=H6QUF7_PUCGT|nr:uncharacterized protein PGTG_22425 [Puccinia graminis f. sp. tritici CRL 75-36-700-3]EHS64618.1 hypothetical protein PGTG_22425 [Puccinia graminis f. sp. tritici CRL 75-36-700-3]